MSSGEAASRLRAPQVSGPPYAGPSFTGPDFAAPGFTPVPPPTRASPPGPGFPPTPGWAAGSGAGLTDEQLLRLPPPSAYPAGPQPVPLRLQRPAVVGLATTLAVTASLLWVCGLSLAWVVAVGATDALGRSGSEGALFHLLDRFRDRMLDGLAVPLFLFPATSVVTAFLLLTGRPWSRLLHTGVGVLALAWSAWWLRTSLLEWSTVALYVGVAVAVLWTPAANRWYGSHRSA